MPNINQRRFALVVAIALAACSKSKPAPVRSDPKVVPFEMTRVEDSVDPLGAITPPSDVTIDEEIVSVGSLGTREVHFARITSSDATRAADVARFRGWLSSIATPAGTRFIVSDVRDEKDALIGCRSLLLTGMPFITNADVEDVKLDDMGDGAWGLNLTLSPSGAASLERATREWVSRRVATTFDGDVVSLPTIHQVMTTKYLITSAPNEATARRIAQELKR